MTRLIPSFLACLIVAALAGTTGCESFGKATSDKERFLQADRRLALAADSVSAAVASRYFDNKPDALKLMRFGLLEANAMQQRGKPLVLKGESQELTDVVDTFERALNRINGALDAKE